MSDEVTEPQLEAASSALFNNRQVLPVVRAIAELEARDVMVTVRVIAQHTQLADSLVRPVVLRLAECGILRALPRSGPRAPLFYAVANHAAWNTLQVLADALVRPTADAAAHRD